MDDGEGIYDAAQAYIESQRNRQTADAGYTASKAELSLRVSAIRKAVSPLGRSDSIRGCRDTLQAARMRRIKLDRAENEARQAKAVYEKMLSSSSDEVPSEALDGLDAELAALEQRIDQLRNSVSMEQGRVAGLGAPVQIETELAQVNEQISRVQQELMAIEMAQDALSEAASELQSRIFPQLTQPASRYISRMTGGRYDQVIVDRELNISAHPAQGAADRRILQLSDGTADQLYLALRLAICDAVLPSRPHCARRRSAELRRRAPGRGHEALAADCCRAASLALLLHRTRGPLEQEPPWGLSPTRFSSLKRRFVRMKLRRWQRCCWSSRCCAPHCPLRPWRRGAMPGSMISRSNRPIM